MTRWRAASIAVGVLLLLGCAASPAALPDREPTPSSDSAEPSESAVPTRSVPGTGDQPPNGVDNNAWKQRHVLSDADRRQAGQVADLIRPALQRLHDIGDFTSTSTHYTLLSLGFSDSAITVQPMRTPADSTSPPPGAAFGVRVGPNACVIGSVELAKVVVEVAGAAAEYGCLEPFSH